MENEIVLVQARIKADVVKRIKDAGYGKFAIGLYFMLAELDKATGDAEEFKSVAVAVAVGGKKSTSRNTYEPDPRLPMMPGETPAAHKKRLTAYIASLPETKRNKIRSQLESYISTSYNLHGGAIDTDEMFEIQSLDAKGNYSGGSGEEVRIMDYITLDELEAWVLKSVAYDKRRKAEDAAYVAATKNTTTGPRPTLSADAKYFYQNFPALLANLTAEQIETMNAECEGALDRGDDPIPEHA